MATATDPKSPNPFDAPPIESTNDRTAAVKQRLREGIELAFHKEEKLQDEISVMTEQTNDGRGEGKRTGKSATNPTVANLDHDDDDGDHDIREAAADKDGRAAEKEKLSTLQKLQREAEAMRLQFQRELEAIEEVECGNEVEKKVPDATKILESSEKNGGKMGQTEEHDGDGDNKTEFTDFYANAIEQANQIQRDLEAVMKTSNKNSQEKDQLPPNSPKQGNKENGKKNSIQARDTGIPKTISAKFDDEENSKNDYNTSIITFNDSYNHGNSNNQLVVHDDSKTYVSMMAAIKRGETLGKTEEQTICRDIVIHHGDGDEEEDDFENMEVGYYNGGARLEEDEEERQRRKRRKRMYYWGFIALLTIFGCIIVALAVMLSGNNDRGGDGGTSSSSSNTLAENEAVQGSGGVSNGLDNLEAVDSKAPIIPPTLAPIVTEEEVIDNDGASPVRTTTNPTKLPSKYPSKHPTIYPTILSTTSSPIIPDSSTEAPLTVSASPTIQPTMNILFSTINPTKSPSIATTSPNPLPTSTPTNLTPPTTTSPNPVPTSIPTTKTPIKTPTSSPSITIITSAPTASPIQSPTTPPTPLPTNTVITPVPTTPSCPTNTKKFELTISLDDDPGEITWILLDPCRSGQGPLHQCINCYKDNDPRTFVNYVDCLPANNNQGYVFQIVDEAGNGLCGNDDGSGGDCGRYTISYDGEVVHLGRGDYGNVERVEFGGVDGTGSEC